MKEWQEERENEIKLEKEQFNRILDELRISADATNREVEYYRSQIEILQNQLEERETQFQQEILILKAQLQNNL